MKVNYYFVFASMTTINWPPEIYQDWLQGQYARVADYYEQKVEQDPESPENYWYLGLTYLLLGQEEQAQFTWLVVLGQWEGEVLEFYQQELIKILDNEAERQEQHNNDIISWVIRGHIRELQPNNYNNLLQFICLDLIVSENPSEKFQNWQLSQLISSIGTEKIKDEILINALSLIPKFPSLDSLEFIRYCLKILEKNSDVVTIIVEAIRDFFYKVNYFEYVIDVLKICSEFDPENLAVINVIYAFYVEFKYLENATEFAKAFIERSSTLTEKIFGYYMILSVTLKMSNWQKALDLFCVYSQLLQDFLGQKIDLKYLFIQYSFVIVGQPLPYFQDSPQKNRLLINYSSKIFQEVALANNSSLLFSSAIDLRYNRPLRIGYIGHTLRAHPVGYLGRWLIHHQDYQHIKNYGYMFLHSSTSFAEEWFINKMDGYYCFQRDIKSAIEQIKADQIDILVDLDSLTCQLTCEVLSLKPAPIQVTWLGFDASGIPNVDYFIADPYVLPDDAQDYYSEKIWRLPNCYLGIDGFEIGVPTLRREDLNIPQDAVIFANFQNALKRHPHILRQQMKILKAVPNSYLLVKGTGKADEIQNLFESIAQEEKIELARLRFLEPCATEMEHRANLGMVDVILDTYPYNGATSTLETLWMGIPLVTRVGEQFAARNSYTFMMNVGVTEGIAWSDEEYVEWGIKLGTDENLRKEISWKLHQSKKTSPLWNGKQFACEMEKAYRKMWEIYVQETVK